MTSSQVHILRSGLVSRPLLCSFRHPGRRKNLTCGVAAACSLLESARLQFHHLSYSPLTSSEVAASAVQCRHKHLLHPQNRTTQELGGVERRWVRISLGTAVLGTVEGRRGRSYHTSLHTTGTAVLGTVEGRRGRSYHTSLHTTGRAVLGTVEGRGYHSSAYLCLPDKKAKVELAVDTLKEKKKAAPKTAEVVEAKPSLARRVWGVVVHSYHGFRLLALDTRVAARLLWKTMNGNSLTRREQKQFRRTAGDIFRVVPFSVFIIIPFMEFLLPVYLWIFPNALPSTFQSSSAKEKRKKKQLKVKMQMAKFLQDTIEDMAVASKNPNKREAVAEFARFFEKIRVSGEQATTEELVKFSHLFEDELTLDNLSRPQLLALCKLLLLQPIGTSNFLRFQLRMKLRQLQADDVLIQKETVESLTEVELQSASQARGMMALGVPADRLKSQLEQWLDLHLVKKIPASLLLLSRALYLPEDTHPSDALQATLSTLPESIVEEAEVLVADTSGENVDNKIRLDLIRQQEQLIQKDAEEKEVEMREKVQQPAAEELVDTAPIISASMTPPLEPSAEGAEVSSISVEELKELNQAVQGLKADQDRTTLEELKEDREEYIEDVADLAEECEDEIQESKGSARLGRRVDAMLSKIDNALQRLETEDNVALNEMREERSDVISTVKLEEALEALKGLSGEAKTRSIVEVLDEDHDGNINLDEIAEVIESLALEDTDITPEHIEQIKELIKKEVVLEEDAENPVKNPGGPSRTLPRTPDH